MNHKSVVITNICSIVVVEKKILYITLDSVEYIVYHHLHHQSSHHYHHHNHQ